MAQPDESAPDPIGTALNRENAPSADGTTEQSDPEPDVALAAYGTLAPGQSNHSVVADLNGIWGRGTIRGHRWTWTRGPYAGLPALRVDPDGAVIAVSVLVSDDLPAHWPRLDAFEGEGYRRVAVPVTMEKGEDQPAGPLLASLYEAINDPDGYEGEPLD